MDWVFKRPPLQSLKDIALIKTCTLFWIQVHSYQLNNFEEYRINWLEIEENIKENVRHVNLPKPIEDQIMYVLNPIGLEILKWIKLHKNKLPSSHILPNKFCWAQAGTIDLKRTAEIIVRNEEISARCRYELASIYCLENHIQFLWNEMPELDRNDICQSFFLCPSFAFRAYWIYITTGNDNQMNEYVRKTYAFDQYSHHCAALLASAEEVNTVATKYFWAKLTPNERNEVLSCLVSTAVKVAKRRTYESLHSSFHHRRCADVLFFLMLHMTKEDQVNTFKGCPLGVLMCSTDWPWHYNLLPTLKCMWNVIPKDDYVDLLTHLSDGTSYQQLLSEVWRNTPVEFKEFTVKYRHFHSIIAKLLEGNHKENLKLILGSEEATAEVKSAVLYSSLIMSPCESLIRDGQWDILQFFLKECVKSKKGGNDFKRQFIEFIDKRRFVNFIDIPLNSQKSVVSIGKFLELLKDIIHAVECQK